MAHIRCMGHSKKRQKAAPPPLRPDLRFKEISAEVLRSDVARIRESMGEGEVHEDMRMLVERVFPAALPDRTGSNEFGQIGRT